MRTLVTGGAGFIGSHYVRRLLADDSGPEVTVLDKLTYAGNRSNLPAEHPRLTFVHGDVCDGGTVEKLLHGHDTVVHFAAESHVDRSLTGAQDFVVTNVLGTQVLMDACLRAEVGRIVHVSTDEVYGSIDAGSWTEDHALEPNSPYAASKAAADLVVRAYHRSHGLPVMITRCSNNYGPYQFIEKAIPLFITRLLSGREIPLYGDGLHVREWLHVDDHCRAVQLVLERGVPGEIYHIGGGTELANRDLVRRLLVLCGADRSRVRPVPDRKGHDRRYALDSGRIERELGFRPAVPFDAGLAEVVRWYDDHREWWESAAARAAPTPESPL
ncbi:dTDP-glucose 4,6-dehydratase [Streptomyces cyaneofuscatus]|uniref:dTDP-glucose 4,6-dehydratase n=1 Tax=Streptomyces cyaneofuscatus TaxID=66883 RepID=UPI0033A55991